MLKDVEWGEYKIGEIFDTNNWVYGKNKQWKTRYDKNKNNRYPVISGITINNGVNYYTEDIPKDNEIFQDSLTISTRGEYSGTVTYHEGKFVLANNILVLNMPNLSKKQKLFIGTIINGLDYGGYDNYPRIDTLKNDKIKLPIKNNKIYFDFMEKFVAELEVQHVAELEAYLTSTGLKDYTLTKEEEDTINNYNKLEWNTFNLEELFGKSTRGKRLKSADRIQGDLPFVTAGEENEGVSAFIGNKVQIFQENTTTIDMFGSAKYRNYKYGGDDHVAIVHTEKLSVYSAIFVTTAINKASHNGQFDYGRNFYAKDADILDIQLPVKDNKPDYKTMEIIISAIHKLVIKDVVLYADKKIEATKNVVNKEIRGDLDE